MFTHAQGDDGNIFETSIGHSTELFILLDNVQDAGHQSSMQLGFDSIEHLRQIIDSAAIEVFRYRFFLRR